MRLAIPLIAVGIAGAARADSVTNQILVSSTQATEANPRSTVFTDSLDATFNAGDDWTLGAGASLTLQGATPAATRSRFGESSGAVTLFSGGADWSASENLTLAATLEVSPKSTQYAGTTIPLLQQNGTVRIADAQLRSATAQFAAGLDISWDSAGRSDLEWSFGAGVQFSHYRIEQDVPTVLLNGNVVSSAQAQQQASSYCAANPQRQTLCRELLAALAGVDTPLDFERFTGEVTAALYRDTDVSLSGDFYVYNQDPNGTFFGLAAAGRGLGLPIAPLRYLVRPEVQHRFGDLSARIWLEGGEYVAGSGGTTAGVGVKLQYRFTKAWRAWLTLSGHRDVDAGDNITRSVTVAAGAGYRW
jgi:hypothetical protein